MSTSLTLCSAFFFSLSLPPFFVFICDMNEFDITTKHREKERILVIELFDCWERQTLISNFFRKSIDRNLKSFLHLFFTSSYFVHCSNAILIVPSNVNDQTVYCCPFQVYMLYFFQIDAIRVKFCSKMSLKPN